MRPNTLKPAAGSKQPRHRVGRGMGSGWGKTAGRGHKGQRARSGGRFATHRENYVQVGSRNGSANLPRFRAGDWVAVSGLRSTDGTILGSAITRVNRGQRVLVSGELQAGDGGKFRLGGLTIEGSDLTVGQIHPAKQEGGGDTHVVA